MLLALVPVAWVKPSFNAPARVLIGLVALVLVVAAFAYGAMRIPKNFELTDERCAHRPAVDPPRR